MNRDRNPNDAPLTWADRDLETELADPGSKHPDAHWRAEVEEELDQEVEEDRGLGF